MILCESLLNGYGAAQHVSDTSPRDKVAFTSGRLEQELGEILSRTDDKSPSMVGLIKL